MIVPIPITMPIITSTSNNGNTQISDAPIWLIITLLSILALVWVLFTMFFWGFAITEFRDHLDGSISGSNQNAFKFAMEGKTPEELMNEIINSERYSRIEA